jgi:broad specificity polyphosphatase/5'/3'-nucleotidase SurE
VAAYRLRWIEGDFTVAAPLQLRLGLSAKASYPLPSRGEGISHAKTQRHKEQGTKADLIKNTVTLNLFQDPFLSPFPHP